MKENIKVIHSPGKILKSGRMMYQDQLSEEYKEFSSYSAEKYLMDNYGLKVYEYYNLVVYGDINKVILCPNCNKNSMKFNGLSKGWSIYCNQSCITTYRLNRETELGINPFQNKDFIELNKERVRKFQKKRMKSGKSHLLSKVSQLIASKNNFIKNHINDVCYLYICKLQGLNNKFKIGICSTNIYSRLFYKGMKMYNHHKLVKGTAELVAELEFLIKRDVCDGLTEIINENDLRSVFNIIRNQTSL